MIETATKGKIVIAGAGVTGLMSALRIKQLDPGANIVIFDKADRPGGMYQSFVYPNGRVFDHGMHLIYESCNPDVDDLYREVMDEQDWHIYAKNEKDIAGLFFRGRLQDYSHYVDLRSFSETEKKRFLGDFMFNLEAGSVDSRRSGRQLLLSQFGNEIVEAVHRPLVQSLYGMNIEEADRFVVKETALERVILFSPDTMLDLMQSDKIRSRLGFPDQMNLPPYRTNDQKALYPKRFGMKHFIERLESAVKQRGVEILTNIASLSLHCSDDRVDSISIVGKDGDSRELAISTLLWTIGWPGMAHALGVNMSDVSMSNGPKVVYANLVFDKSPEMGRLYYFYCYDPGFAAFRVTNYTNYCPAASADGFPVCVELWPSRLGLEASQLSDEQCLALAMDELRRMGVITDSHKLEFSAIENKGGGFPLPSMANTDGIREIKKRVFDKGINNVEVAGIMAEDDLFFIPDILNHAFSVIEKTFTEKNRT
ncbi:MAG: NAD(P)-binding protein [Nitrosomonas sp.]|nr:NAD(P)-binding protein [Nitrosomonas sp.]